MTSNWRYVPTKLNVADDATKWTNQFTLKNLDRWFLGPEFLYQEEAFWPRDTILDNEIIENAECLFVDKVVKNHCFIKIERFSSYLSLLKTMAYALRFCYIMLSIYRKSKRPKGVLISSGMENARNIIIRQVQQEFFEEEIKELSKDKNKNIKPTVKKSSILYKISPCLDKDGLLRVRSRLDQAKILNFDSRQPTILPRESYLTNLIIKDYHEHYNHKNHETVVNEIRQKYYIPKLRRALYKVKQECQMCKIKLAQPIAPEMSPLPDCRLAVSQAPFTHTGVDYFGPITVKIGRRLEKRWGVLFTCLTIRAIHVEVAYKLDADSCIICFSKFINRRGRPRHIYCDRGTNFIATERLLKRELKTLDPSLIEKSFINPELEFHFNPPLSPHMGGAWERLVKAVKIALYDALPNHHTPSDELLQACLVTAENIVNSRPLTYLPLDAEENEALTPNHFLLGSSSGDKPMTEISDDEKTLKRNYLYREQFANKCWKRFVSEYLPNLILRPKWHKQVPPIKEGDIVIICDKDLPRCNWPKGRVLETKTSKDGQTIKAKVQTVNGIFERPVVKLAVLSIENSKRE